MPDKSTNPVIQWYELKGRRCLKFVFKGNFTEQDAEISTKEWESIFKREGNRTITLVWDCIEMTGYDSTARSIWQKKIKELKSQIASIWVITNSKLIIGGVKILSVFTSFEMKVVTYEDEIYFK